MVSFIIMRNINVENIRYINFIVYCVQIIKIVQVYKNLFPKLILVNQIPIKIFKPLRIQSFRKQSE